MEILSHTFKNCLNHWFPNFFCQTPFVPDVYIHCIFNQQLSKVQLKTTVKNTNFIFHKNIKTSN